MAAVDADTAAGPTASSSGDVGRDMVDYYEARAPEYDDWYLRRGRYERGAIHDAAWNAELDAAGRWLDGLPWRGEIVELAAGTGWWSPLLASRGELSLYDASPAALDRARERLLAHGLRAHLHVRDAWAEPDREIDAHTIAWKIAPRINAPGRLGAAEPSLSLLLADSDSALDRAQALEAANAQRRAIQDQVMDEALAMLGDSDPGPAIVLAGEGWPTAVASARAWLRESLEAADELQVGSGSGPVHHFAGLWARGSVMTRPQAEQLASGFER